MRIAALILAILGALAALGVGGLFLLGSQMAKGSPSYLLALEIIRDPVTPEPVRAGIRAAYSRLFAFSYFMVAAVPLCILGGLLAMSRNGICAGFLLLIALSGPVAMAVGFSQALPPPDPRHALRENPSKFLMVMAGIPTGFMALASLLAFLVQLEKRGGPVPESAWAENSPPPPRRGGRHRESEEDDF